jgi:uncharacterized PurR-regulated membrane protein YhhQ (DUF165 family)
MYVVMTVVALLLKSPSNVSQTANGVIMADLHFRAVAYYLPRQLLESATAILVGQLPRYIEDI